VAAKATTNKTMIENVSTLLTTLMAVAVRWYYRAHRLMEEVHGFHKSNIASGQILSIPRHSNTCQYDIPVKFH
jgi:hypothetical protein